MADEFDIIAAAGQYKITGNPLIALLYQLRRFGFRGQGVEENRVSGPLLPWHAFTAVSLLQAAKKEQVKAIGVLMPGKTFSSYKALMEDVAKLQQVVTYGSQVDYVSGNIEQVVRELAAYGDAKKLPPAADDPAGGVKPKAKIPWWAIGLVVVFGAGGFYLVRRQTRRVALPA